MATFMKITDIDGDVHLCNLAQLCACAVEKKNENLYNCTMQFCDNVSSFYLTKKKANRLINALSEDI